MLKAKEDIVNADRVIKKCVGNISQFDFKFLYHLFENFAHDRMTINNIITKKRFATTFSEYRIITRCHGIIGTSYYN